ncbi:MAG TPA: gephyrin-like molybdotransferase Glp [Microthrixaceae bacterium]|nr:gephyrin-like molybdotransferase Glp [Microthrixaceae bacterium]
MIPLEEARRFVLDRVEPTEVVEVRIDQSQGLALAEVVRSDELVPPFANSAMDGFAVRAADTSPGARLKVVATVAAGSGAEVTIATGEAARIMTGALMPDGADSVVMVEDTTVSVEPPSGEVVTIGHGVDAGHHVRPAGDDMRPGDEVLPAGTEVTPAVIGVLHTLGRRVVMVHRRPVVGVMSTGDELVEGGGPLGRGQIRDSNRPTLSALAAAAGCEVVDLGVVRDDPDAIRDALHAGVARCDAILSSGGVSMGDFDHVKAVLDEIGDMRWMQVAIRPAKPLAFGTIDSARDDPTRAGRVPVFGLPGNPVSSIVSFELFARPGLRRLMGHRSLDRPRVGARAAEPLSRRSDGKVHFARVVTAPHPDGGLEVRSAGSQGSHHTAAMATADALAVLPDGDGVSVGDAVEIILLAP